MKKLLISLLFLISTQKICAIPIDIQAIGGLALTSVGLWTHLHTEANLSTIKAFENISNQASQIDQNLFQSSHSPVRQIDFCEIDEYKIKKITRKDAGEGKPDIESIQTTKNGQSIDHTQAVQELKERYKWTPFFQKASDTTALLGFGIFLHAGFRLTKTYFNNNR